MRAGSERCGRVARNESMRNFHRAWPYRGQRWLVVDCSAACSAGRLVPVAHSSEMDWVRMERRTRCAARAGSASRMMQKGDWYETSSCECVCDVSSV